MSFEGFACALNATFTPLVATLLRPLQAFKQPFTAVLCSPGVNSSSSKFTAVISRTNRLLRAHLATYGCEGLVAGQLEQQAAGQQQQRQGKQQQQLVSVDVSMEVGASGLTCTCKWCFKRILMRRKQH